MELVNYEKYDFFIIVSGRQFTNDDLWLSKEMKKRGKAFFFVRSRVDEDLMNAKRDHPNTFSEENVLHQIKLECSTFIKEVDPAPNVFVISGLLENVAKFDYTQMEQTLLQSFPANKRQDLIRSMKVISKGNSYVVST